MLRRRSLWLRTLGILIALSAAICNNTLAADAYPTMPVRFVLGSEPGGGPDIAARLIAPILTQRLGKPVIVENRPGAGHVIATEMVSKAKPDGHTLLVLTTSHTIQPLLQKLPYDPIKSFTPIAFLAEGPYVLVVHPSVPANSVKELIAFAKQKPNQVIFGTSGAGAGPHMAAELFQMMAGIDVKIVHFKGAGPALTDLVGGHSHALICSSTAALPHVKSGKLKLLGTGLGGTKRSVAIPDASTIAQAGGLPGYKATTWFAILGPAGLPAPIAERLTSEIKAILEMDEVKNPLLKTGAEVSYLGPAELNKFLEDDLKVNAQIIKKANIKLE
jgi:tripartite-type tricarboxylate transporter receptor subunit TctC